MANDLILLDTSVLIDYYRTKDKSKSLLVQLAEKNSFAISVVTKYEFLAGTKPERVAYTNSIIENIEIKNMNLECIDIISSERKWIYKVCLKNYLIEQSQFARVAVRNII